MNYAIGEWMRFTRKKAKLRQDEVAESLGVLRSTVAHWETHRTMPSKENIEKYGVLVNQSFTGEVRVEPNDKAKDSFNMLTNQDIDSMLLLLKIRQCSQYETILLVQDFVRIKNT